MSTGLIMAAAVLLGATVRAELPKVALELDGSDDYIKTTATAADLGIDGNKARTVEAWVKARHFNGGGVFSVGTTGSDSRDFSFRARRPNGWRVQIWGEDIDFSHPSENRWIHFAIVHNGTETIVYADGEEVTRASRQLDTHPDDEPFRIGRWRERNFDGMIAEVRVWTRALSEEEIRAAKDRPLAGNERGLVGYWPLNEHAGETVRDRTANARHGQWRGKPEPCLAQPFKEDLEKKLAVKPGEPLTLGPVTLRHPLGEVSYQWFFNGDPIVGATADTLEIAGMTADDVGEYHVQVDDDLELTPVESTRLVIAEWPVWEAALPALQSVTLGEAVTLGPAILYAPRGEVKYQWYFNGTPIEGATAPTLDLAGIEADYLGRYDVRVADELKRSPVYATVRLVEPDWPMWGFDAQRSGASPAVRDLPDELHLHWMRELPPPRRAWRAQMDDGDKLEFDLSYSPVVVGNRLFVASMTADHLTAYAADTGEKLWRFHADGPVRLAPAAWNGKIYFVSDDGRLYCLDAASGEKRWSFDAAPGDHRVLGNERVISMWAARGGPVVKDGRVYFAAGVWPFLGTFLFALDAETGEVQWSNQQFPDQWQRQPHGGANAFAGIVPQGYLAVQGDRVVVSGGRSPPAVFDRGNGELLHLDSLLLSGGSKADGGYRVRIDGEYYFNHGRRYRLRDGQRAGSGLFLHPDRQELNRRTAEIEKVLEADDEIFEAMVARDRLYVSTRSGRIYCFGAKSIGARRMFRYAPSVPEPQDSDIGRRAEAILEQSDIKEGYALVLGTGDGEFLEQLAVRSDLHIVAIEPERERVASVRERLERAGLYGSRVAVLPGRFDQMHLPSYIYSLIVEQDAAALGPLHDASAVARLYDHVRPYDGRAYLLLDREREAALAEFTPENGRVLMGQASAALLREGPLPDAGQWTHQYADAAQTVLSRDRRVRPPFGPIWYGGPTHDNIVPRHASGPRPQVAGGRVIVLGVETISARCVFTGRELWVHEFPGIGHPFTNLSLERRWRDGRGVYMTNQPGASYIGSPYVSLPDAIYVRHNGHVVRLDPASGEKQASWSLPARADDDAQNEFPDWGHLSVQGDTVITTTDPHIFRGGRLGTDSADRWDGTSSERLIALDRHTGETLWTRDAAVGFRHNAIVSSGKRLYLTDLLSEEAVAMAARRGMGVEQAPRLYALDVRTGQEIWSVGSDVFGTFLSYSEDHDILIEGGSTDGRRPLPDEPRHRMIARRGANGETIWNREGRYDGPVILRDDTIIPARPGPAINVLTGETVQGTHPITDDSVDLAYWRSYGCGTANASQYLLLFRSASAGFADLEHFSGTSTLGGFRSGCTSSMIAADGVLNAPDYTRTCTCAYQNQTSLGLIHMPEMDLWVVNRPMRHVSGALRRVGVNLGAPGDRRAQNGTFWVHEPRDSPSLHLDVRITAEGCEDDPARWLREHSLRVDPGENGLHWVAASAKAGLRRLVLRDVLGDSEPHNVTLHFAELEDVPVGGRLFNIVLDNQTVVEGFDVVQAAGGAMKATTLSFEDVAIGRHLTVELVPTDASSRPPILSGLEVIRREAQE